MPNQYVPVAARIDVKSSDISHRDRRFKFRRMFCLSDLLHYRGVILDIGGPEEQPATSTNGYSRILMPKVAPFRRMSIFHGEGEGLGLVLVLFERFDLAVHGFRILRRDIICRLGVGRGSSFGFTRFDLICRSLRTGHSQTKRGSKVNNA